jgi:hypothetical protein
MYSGVLTAEEVDVIGRKGSEYTTFDVQTFLEASLGTSLGYAFFNDKAFFSGQEQFLVLGILSSSAILSGFTD